MSKILVTGGAGYIGSITVRELLDKGFSVVVLDNLSLGHRWAVDKRAKLEVGDLLQKETVFDIFAKYKFSGVIHFAALALAPESMEKPAKYFENNLLGALNLLEGMRKEKVDSLVFSSSCAVYGVPKKEQVTEDDEKKPVSVYGQSKLMCEEIISWYQKIYGINYINLRYFNACGAALDGTLGEDHANETHLIPLALQTALNQRKQFTLYGNDYPTRDGSCIRDYIHVVDLAHAHAGALEYIDQKKQSDSFNVACGRGYSVWEVINKIKEVTKVDFKVVIGQQRPGDPAAIWANNSKIVNTLGWQPKYSDLETIINSVWKWHREGILKYKLT